MPGDDQPQSKAASYALRALEQRIAYELGILEYPAVDWVQPVAAPDGTVALDCAIIGAGQIGLTVAAGLRREHVQGVALFDAAPAGREGPWRTFARMAMLRTPKELTGPDLGLPSLGVRAWWEAQHGEQSWQELHRIPRDAWMNYLVWYRRVMDLNVRNEQQLAALAPAGPAMFRLDLLTPEGPRTAYARTVVLCTGAGGSGGHVLPPAISAAVPAHLAAHTNDVFDLEALRGRRVGILGAGASAFDTAIAALEHGAAEVHLCFRRRSLPLQNPRRWMENPGFLAHYGALPDERKWAYMHRLLSIGQPPPQPTLARALALPGFHIHPATPWDRVSCTDGRTIHVEGGGKSFGFDFVVAGTGIAVDLEMRPELAPIREHVALWRDRFTPQPGLDDLRLGRFLYLGPHGELQERVPGEAPYLRRIHAIPRAGTLSLGPVAASNSGLKYIAPLLVRGVTRTLFLDQSEAAWDAFTTGNHDEIADPMPHRAA